MLLLDHDLYGITIGLCEELGDELLCRWNDR
jgi:hypothetical protein